MIVENKLKGIFVLILSIIYWVLLLMLLYFSPESIANEIAIGYLLLDSVLLATSIYILAKKGAVGNYINIEILITSFLLATILIYSTGFIKSEYFPILYLSLIIYAALNKGRKLLYATTFLVLSTIFSLILLSPYSLQPAEKLTFLLYIIVFFVIITVIRNYPFECLKCKIRSDNCPYRNSCPINMEVKDRGELSAIKLYKKS